MKNDFLNQKRGRTALTDNQNNQDFEIRTPQEEEQYIELDDKIQSIINQNSNKLNNIVEEEELDDKDDYISVEKIFEYNCKEDGIKCSYCEKDITKNIKFYCKECNNLLFCIYCFIQQKHPISHKYTIINDLKFPLFAKDWQACEEHKLISNISFLGLNNWEDIGNKMENKTKDECEIHYYTFFYTESENPLPKEDSIILDENKNINEDIEQMNQDKLNHIKEIFKKNNDIKITNEEQNEKNKMKKKCRFLSLRRNLKNGEAENAGEILGCRIKRKEFETEFFNDAELEVSQLEFDDSDKEDELKIKYDVLRDYNFKLSKREQRKNVVFEKGLLDLKRINRIESKLNRDEFEILLFLKPFQKFFPNSEFYDLFEGLLLEQELKLIMKNLNKLQKEKNNQGGKISSIEEIEKFYDVDKTLNRTRKYGNLFTNISEPKNVMNYLGHRMGRFLDYHKLISDSEFTNEEDNKNKLFDDDEYQFIKEMPLAISTCYDIKKRVANLMSSNLNENEFATKLSELLGKYDLECQTKKDLNNFYLNKYKDNISEEQFIDINIKDDVNNETLFNDKNKINGINNLINNNIIINNDINSNNGNSKLYDFQALKSKFNDDLAKDP